MILGLDPLTDLEDDFCSLLLVLESLPDDLREFGANDVSGEVGYLIRLDVCGSGRCFQGGWFPPFRVQGKRSLQWGVRRCELEALVVRGDRGGTNSHKILQYMIAMLECHL